MKDKRALLKTIDEEIIEVWNTEGIDNNTKFVCVKKLEEIQMILQGEIIE